MEYRLTEYSHGAGCGCKLSPGILSDILESTASSVFFPALLVGNESRDDAAVFDLDGQTAIVSTTDFFMPIVDDPCDFGGIAAANAISDIYAMGAEPLMAIAILGWPIDKIPPSVAAQVLIGARRVCEGAGIPLAGGHSIDAPEPIFGLAVTGKAPIRHIKKNTSGQNGDLLYLTKPIGIGLVSTAQKRKIADAEDIRIARDSMLQLNSIGKELGGLGYVHALTDVTGFGLGGHLIEICEGSQVQAILWQDKIPVFPFVHKYLDKRCLPGGTSRNWKTYGEKIDLPDPNYYPIIADPQTSGGLLISVNPEYNQDFIIFMNKHSMDLKPIGTLVEKNDGFLVTVR